MGRVIRLSHRQVELLTIELNIKLRDRRLSDEHGNELNDVFKQLTGRDHESQEDRDERAKPLHQRLIDNMRKGKL